MGFVRSAAELAAMNAVQEASVFHAENVTAVIDSDQQWLASVVPEPLRVTDDSFVLSTTRSQTNMLGDTIGVIVNVPVTLDGVDGLYTLAIYYAPEAAIQWGRDLVGEPKKAAQITFSRFGHQRRATADRGGVRLVELEVVVDRPEPPSAVSGVLYTVRALLAPDWRSFDGRVGLLATYTDAEVREEWSGTGTVAFQSTPHDPLGDLPVRGVRQASARESRVTVRGQEIVADLDGDQYLPFYYGQHLDDWSQMGPLARRLDWS